MEVSIREFLKKRKNIVGPIVFFVLSFFIVARVIVPLFSNISSEKAKLDEQQTRVNNLNTTFGAIQAINADNIEGNLALMRDALPQNKDIVLIYSTLISIASKNEMNVESFSVQVGQIYNRNGESEIATASAGTNIELPALKVNVEVSADDTNQLFQFSKDLMASLPLSNVNTLITDEEAGTYDVSFFYKPINTAALSEQEFVTPLSPEEKNVLETIRGFESN